MRSLDTIERVSSGSQNGKFAPRRQGLIDSTAIEPALMMAERLSVGRITSCLLAHTAMASHGRKSARLRIILCR